MALRFRWLFAIAMVMGWWGLAGAPDVALGQCDPEDPFCQPVPATPVPPFPTATPLPSLDQAPAATTATAPPLEASQDVWDCLDDAVQCVLNMTKYVIEFPAHTLQEALLTIAQEVGTGFYRAARENLVGPLDQLITGPLGIAPGSGSSGSDGSAALPITGLPTVTVYQLFRDDFIVSRVAMQVRNLAFALLPFTLILSLADALKKGAESVLGRAELQTAVVRWITSVVGVAICFPTLSLIYSMSVSLYQYAFTAALGSNLGNLGRVVLEAVLGEALLLLVSSLNPASAGLLALSLVVILFLVILAVLVLGALALGLAASVALIGILATIGPICIALSALEPLEWMDEMWIRGVGIALFLPVIDLFILGFLMAVIGQIDRSGLWGAVLSALIAFGLTGLLISLNMAVGNAVFGPVLQAAKMTGDIVTAIGGMVTTAVTMGVAAAALGPVALGAAPAAAGAAEAGVGAATGAGVEVAGVGAGLGQATASTSAAGVASGTTDVGGTLGVPACGADAPNSASHVRARVAEVRGRAVASPSSEDSGAGSGSSEGSPVGGDSTIATRARETAGQAREEDLSAIQVGARARVAGALGRVMASSGLGPLRSVGMGLSLGADLAAGEGRDAARRAHATADAAREDYAFDRDASRERQARAMLSESQERTALAQENVEIVESDRRERRVRDVVSDLRDGQEPGEDVAYRRRANGRSRNIDRRARDDDSPE